MSEFLEELSQIYVDSVGLSRRDIMPDIMEFLRTAAKAGELGVSMRYGSFLNKVHLADQTEEHIVSEGTSAFIVYAHQGTRATLVDKLKDLGLVTKLTQDKCLHISGWANT